ncbi:MAG: hypothetical protein ACREMY_18845, partial [bacterium]
PGGMPGSNDPVTITLFVQDANGCPAPEATVTVPIRTIDPPQINVTSDACTLGSDSATVPAQYANYWWTVSNANITGGLNTNTITFTPFNATDPVMVSVSVQDAGGCSANSAPVTVSIDTIATPVITASGPTNLCSGGSVTLTAPAGFSYSWSNGATTQAITVSTAGNYTVTMHDAGGCSATSAPANVTVTAPPLASIISAQVGDPNPGGPQCAGPPVTLTAKPDGMSYVWSTGETTQTITVSAAGSFLVTVSNANGCSTSSFIFVEDNAPKPVIDTPAATTFCGSMQLTASHLSNQMYWNREGVGQIGSGTSVTIGESGSYYLSVFYGNGCYRESDRVTVTRLPNLQGSIAASLPKLCPGGSVTLTANVDDPNATFLWSTGATTKTITTSQTGFYQV